MIRLRPYERADSGTLLTLFRETVRVINRRDDTPEQIAAWSSDAIDPASWADRFEGRFAYVAEFDAAFVEFADMTSDGYLDRLFVAATRQRQGVATLLLERIIDDARELGIQAIETDASITAKPFFERFGFTVRRQQSVGCRGATFTNYRITRVLD